MSLSFRDIANAAVRGGLDAFEVGRALGVLANGCHLDAPVIELPPSDCHPETLRDHFAAKALPKVIAFNRNRGAVGTPDEAARLAYQYADAMMRARAGGA